MSAKIEFDETDLKILRALINDARTKLKDMAKECGISSVAVLQRIKSLKKAGVITGATLFPNLREVGGVIVATLGVDLEAGKEEEILGLIQRQANVIEPSPSIGKYDLCALIFAENLVNLENTTQTVRKRDGVKRVTTNMWGSNPAMIFQNIDLQPGKPDQHG